MLVDSERGKRYKFEEEDIFTYLGAVFLRKPNVTQEIMASIMAGNRCVRVRENYTTENY